MKRITPKKFILITTFILTSCGKQPISWDHPVSLMDYVVDLGVIDNYDEKVMMDYCKENFFVTGRGGCSCVVTQVDGKNIVGRNNDIVISENPVFKYVLDINQYKAIGISYTYEYGDLLNYNHVLKNGLDDFSKTILPFIGTDYLNEEGLYIETNMRMEEEGYEVTGTNPNSDVDVYLMSFPAYAITRCKNVNEAVELATNGINIYNNIDPEKSITWNFAFTLADAEGNYGLLEVAKNQVSFLPRQNGQANFYATDDFAKDAKFQCGEPRFQAINQRLDQVKTLDDMLRQMENSYYSWAYEWDKLDEAPYDIRTECVGELPVNNGGYVSLVDGDYENCTTEWIMDDARTDYVFDIIKSINQTQYISYKNEDGSWNLSKLRKDYGTIEDFWITMFSIAVDCSNKKMKVRFFQDSSKQLEFSL